MMPGLLGTWDRSVLCQLPRAEGEEVLQNVCCVAGVEAAQLWSLPSMEAVQPWNRSQRANTTSMTLGLKTSPGMLGETNSIVDMKRGSNMDER